MDVSFGMKRLGVLFGLVGVLGVCLYLLLADGSSGGDDSDELEIYCAAVLQKPVEEVARRYEEEYGVKVRLNFGGSGQLLAKLEVADGDLYLPADVGYIEMAREKGLVVAGGSIPVSYLTAGIIVKQGNPKGIRMLSDLARDGVRVVIAERSAAVGKFTHEVLEEEGLLAAIEGGDVSKTGTVSEVAMQVELGAADAGVVWDAVMPQFRGCEFVRAVEFEKVQKYAEIGVLKSSQRGAEALKFARYLTGKDEGAVIFRKHGFDVMSKKDEKISEQ